MAESYGTGAAYASKNNIVRPTEACSEAVLAVEAAADYDARLTGGYAGGHVQSSSAATTTETGVVLTLQDGAASQDENQVVILPEGVTGTFTIRVTDSGGLKAATAAIDLDASAATVQTALNLVQTTSNGIVVTKATGRRVFGLTWSHATEDEADRAATVLAVTVTGDAVPDIP